MTKITFTARDGKKLICSLWDNVPHPIGVVQIIHGMDEHVGRYERFADFLNKHGYIVFGDDHRAHGRTATDISKIGMPDGDPDLFASTVADEIAITKYLRKKFKLPVLIFGHSYGSFLSQRFMELNGRMLKGVILSGTAYMKTPLLRIGYLIASAQAALCGPEKIGYLIDKMSFGSFNKPFEDQGQQFAWLSRDKKQVEKYEQDEYCGYPLCIGFYRSFFHGVTEMYEEGVDNIPKNLPVLIAVGGEDPVSNRAALAQKLYNFYKEKGLTDVTYKVYPGARHEILNEINRPEVYADFLRFIQSVFAR